jgi:hypothetical protein
LGRSEQHFNPVGARSQATMLTLAAIVLILPAAFQAAEETTAEGFGRLSVWISVVLLLVYLLYLATRLLGCRSSQPCARADIVHRVAYRVTGCPNTGPACCAAARRRGFAASVAASI